MGQGGGHGAGNAGFAFNVEDFALRIGHVFHRGARHPHAAMKAREQPLVGQALHIAAYGLQRHAKLVR